MLLSSSSDCILLLSVKKNKKVTVFVVFLTKYIFLLILCRINISCKAVYTKSKIILNRYSFLKFK